MVLRTNVYRDVKVIKNSNEDYRMRTSIHEHFGYDSYVDINLCPICNEEYVQVMPSDPGHPVHQVLAFDMCNECNDKLAKADLDFPIHVFSEWEEVEDYRKSQGFRPYNEALSEKQKQWEERAEDAQIGYEQLQQDTEQYSEREVALMAYIYNAGPNPDLSDPDYYDPHADLIRDRARELGVI